ncbi:MAG: FAD-binding protein, partial [Terrimicrobiaceae bacterium]|nr:FAD-binding protein [Terrimicrobiaceae bacterium]
DVYKRQAPVFLRGLRRALPAEALVLERGALEAYSGDKWFARELPLAAVLPSTTEQVSRVLRLAAKHGVAVTPRGAGFGYVGGCVPAKGGIVISAERMDRILEVSEADFVAVAQPGVRTLALQKAAAARGLYYPPDPASLRHSSIGGNIATNAGGPKCLKYGVTRNYVLGLEVVLPDGGIVRCGGRTHKNKTGLDLTGLFVGSEGLLGFVTEATLRLLPLPPARAGVSAGVSTIGEAARAIRAVFRAGFLPAALEVADEFTLEAARKFRPAGRFPRGGAQVIVEVDGQPASVRRESADLAALLEGCGAADVVRAATEKACEAVWDLRRAYSEALKATGLTKLNEDVVVPRGRLEDLVKFARALEQRSGFPIACFGHAGDGNIHVNRMVPYPSDSGTARRSRAALDELFRKVLEWGGAITGE